MDDALPRGNEGNIMTVESLIKKYNISPAGDKIRVEKIQDADEKELEQIKAAKQEILQYFRNQEEDKHKKEEALIEKAKRGDDGLFLVIRHDLGYDTCILPARRLNEEEKKMYSEWFCESGFVGMGVRIPLKQIRYHDMPKRKPDGTFSGGSDSAWIINLEEYDKYIKENEKREKEIQEKEKEQRRQWEEKKAQYEKEKSELISKVDDWSIREYNIYDEGGKTKVYQHCFRIGGSTLSFTERNVFDFGIVINPDYEIIPGESGGIAIRKDGVLQWHTFSSDNGWIPVRPLTEHEKICWTIIAKYGKFAGSSIRM